MKNQRTFSLVAWVVIAILAGGVAGRAIFEVRALARASEGHDEAGRIDESDDTFKRISDALALARPGHKQVILEFGSRQCTWCHLLEKAFESDPRIAAELEKNFIIVKVDVSSANNNRVNTRYGSPIGKGLPVSVFLDSDGRQLLTQNIAFADEEALGHGTARVDPDRILEYLKQRSEKRAL
jgi:thiol:disulfide interchange protein